MSKQLGIVVLIERLLRGNEESAKIFSKVIGKKIKALGLQDNNLQFTFEDDSKIRIFDNGQSCCEQRFMTTDDKLPDYVGSTLLSAEIADADYIKNDDEYSDEHEIQFLRIETDKGTFTTCTHNIHNGYYGGFAVVITEG